MPIPERKAKPREEIDTFEARLRMAGLTKVRFAALTGVVRTSVARWAHQGVPPWTVTWLMMYQKSTKTTKEKMDAFADFTPPKIR